MQAHETAQGSATAEQAVREWQSLGITTLEEVAQRILAAERAERTALRRLPLDFDTIYKETPSELARTARYTEMQYTVVVDGSETKDLSAYDGRVLHFVAEPETFAEGRLHAFTSLSELKARLGTLQTEEAIMTIPPDSLTPNCVFWDDVGFRGNVKSVGPNLWYSDLTRVTRNVFWQDWNDQISSLEQSRSFRVAWDDVNGEGLTLTMIQGWGHTNLVEIGWNDRISSIANYG